MSWERVIDILTLAQDGVFEDMRGAGEYEAEEYV